ncbi:NifU family protein [Polyangium aurulentum]|uniref:NifU family protein n=1 Tax=Polyangium aurulentum TaxID=2567896 RepID=UPI001F25A0FA|nr:NifU family protein [Polyangium aurulentum]
MIAPLVRADQGELYIVAVEPDQITLHLAGMCSGCPGASLTTKSVIEPAVHAVAPSARVVVTSGIRIPDGASLVT